MELTAAFSKPIALNEAEQSAWLSEPFTFVNPHDILDGFDSSELGPLDYDSLETPSASQYWSSSSFTIVQPGGFNDQIARSIPYTGSLDEQVGCQSNESASYTEGSQYEGDTISAVSESTYAQVSPMMPCMPNFAHTSSGPMTFRQNTMKEEPQDDERCNQSKSRRRRPASEPVTRRPRRSAAPVVSKAPSLGSRKRTRLQENNQLDIQEALHFENELSAEDEEEEAENLLSSKTLACPFYKLSRVDHIDCARFQLKRVKDVKQHLLRKHPFHCADCFEVFATCKACMDHVQKGGCKPACGIRRQDKTFSASISSKQKSELSKRMNAGSGDEAQSSWFSIWKILFPEKPQPDSPFVASAVEEAISTVRELWEENRSKVLSSLGEDWLSDHVSRQLQTYGTAGLKGSKDCFMTQVLQTLSTVSTKRTCDRAVENAPTDNGLNSKHATCVSGVTGCPSAFRLLDPIQLSDYGHPASPGHQYYSLPDSKDMFGHISCGSGLIGCEHHSPDSCGTIIFEKEIPASYDGFIKTSEL